MKAIIYNKEFKAKETRNPELHKTIWKEPIITKSIQWINQPLINKSEVARQMNISTILFRMKLNNINRNRFTSAELKKLDDIRTRIYNSL